jgi:hypothetical protein
MGPSSHQHRLEVRPAPGVQDVAGLDPAAAGLADAEAHGAEPHRRMGVGGDGDPETEILGHPAVHVVEVEAARMGVKLEKAAALFRSSQHALEIDRIAGPLADEPSGRVGEDVE